MDIFLASVAILCGVVGIAGSIVPALPGPPVSWLGLLALSFTRWYDRPAWFLLLWLGVVIVVTVLDNFLPVVMTKKFGGSRAATWGTVIGMTVGMFFGPWGLILGPFAGAYAGELVNSRRAAANVPANVQGGVTGNAGGGSGDGSHALRVATGAFFAFIGGVGIKMVAAGMILYFMVREIVV